MVSRFRSLSVFAALLLASGAAAAHSSHAMARASGAGGRPAVEVVGHGWKPHVYRPWLKSAEWYIEPVGEDVPGFQYRVVVRNTARRAVRAVEWEYRFFDRGTGALVSQHPFRSLTRIKPGRVSSLTAFSVKPPTRSIDAAASGAGPALDEEIAILSVVFEDGSRQTF